MKHTNPTRKGAALAAGSLALILLVIASCSPKKDVTAKGTQAVQYRLKMTDKDGNTTYSKVVTVNE